MSLLSSQDAAIAFVAGSSVPSLLINIAVDVLPFKTKTPAAAVLPVVIPLALGMTNLAVFEASSRFGWDYRWLAAAAGALMGLTLSTLVPGRARVHPATALALAATYTLGVAPMSEYLMYGTGYMRARDDATTGRFVQRPWGLPTLGAAGMALVLASAVGMNWHRQVKTSRGVSAVTMLLLMAFVVGWALLALASHGAGAVSTIATLVAALVVVTGGLLMKALDLKRAGTEIPKGVATLLSRMPMLPNVALMAGGVLFAYVTSLPEDGTSAKPVSRRAVKAFGGMAAIGMGAWLMQRHDEQGITNGPGVSLFTLGWLALAANALR